MKHSILTLFRTNRGYHTVLKTNHGRLVYLALSEADSSYNIDECIYIDRSLPCSPKKQVSKKIPQERLLDMLRAELDKDFASVQFTDAPIVSKQELIERHLYCEKKNILLLLKEQKLLKTIFKNKFRREIYLEISLDGEKALIARCHYCDARAGGKIITPQGLSTIYYKHSLQNLLQIVNRELEGGFTDIMVSDDHTITLDRAICGSI